MKNRLVLEKSINNLVIELYSKYKGETNLPGILLDLNNILSNDYVAWVNTIGTSLINVVYHQHNKKDKVYPMKIGKAIRNILVDNGVDVKEKEIELFVQLWRGSMDSTGIEIIEGENMRKWYLQQNYAYPGTRKSEDGAILHPEPTRTSFKDFSKTITVKTTDYYDNPPIPILKNSKNDNNEKISYVKFKEFVIDRSTDYIITTMNRDLEYNLSDLYNCVAFYKCAITTLQYYNVNVTYENLYAIVIENLYIEFFNRKKLCSLEVFMESLLSVLIDNRVISRTDNTVSKKTNTIKPPADTKKSYEKYEVKIKKIEVSESSQQQPELEAYPEENIPDVRPLRQNVPNFLNDEISKGTLSKSCMRYDFCQKYLDFYIDNPDRIKMLIMKDANGKLIARALVWKTDQGYWLMDRVYYTNESDVFKFEKYAEDKGWFWAITSSFPNNKKWYINGEIVHHNDIKITFKCEKLDYNYYPYLDSFSFFDWNSFSFINSETHLNSVTTINFKDTKGYYKILKVNTHESFNKNEAEWLYSHGSKKLLFDCGQLNNLSSEFKWMLIKDGIENGLDIYKLIKYSFWKDEFEEVLKYVIKNINNIYLRTVDIAGLSDDVIVDYIQKYPTILCRTDLRTIKEAKTRAILLKSFIHNPYGFSMNYLYDVEAFEFIENEFKMIYIKEMIKHYSFVDMVSSIPYKVLDDLLYENRNMFTDVEYTLFATNIYVWYNNTGERINSDRWQPSLSLDAKKRIYIILTQYKKFVSNFCKDFDYQHISTNTAPNSNSSLSFYSSKDFYKKSSPVTVSNKDVKKSPTISSRTYEILKEQIFNSYDKTLKIKYEEDVVDEPIKKDDVVDGQIMKNIIINDMIFPIDNSGSIEDSKKSETVVNESLDSNRSTEENTESKLSKEAKDELPYYTNISKEKLDFLISNPEKFYTRKNSNRRKKN